MVDFIGIGTPKAATTWIAACLDEHPELCVAPVKETHFFTTHYERGLAWYKKQFASCSEGVLKGEYDPNYLSDWRAMERIHKVAPGVKLIVCLRNPIERLISAHYFRSLNDSEVADIEERLRQADESETKAYLKREAGLYAAHLTRILKHFPREQLYIGMYEDIERDPLGFIQDIYAFLGVARDFKPKSATEKKNVTAADRVRSRSLERFVRRLYAKLLRTLPNPVLKGIRALRLHTVGWKLYHALNWRPEHTHTPVEKKEASKELREELRSYYHDDMRELERLLDRDLSFWR